MRVKQIMSQPVITVGEQATLEEIARLMLKHRIACVPVGIVARHDLLKMMAEHKTETPSDTDIPSI